MIRSPLIVVKPADAATIVATTLPPSREPPDCLGPAPRARDTLRRRLYPDHGGKEVLEMTDRPEVVVFDVLETLIDLDPLGARLEEVGQPAALLEPWFMRFQRDAMALTLAGDDAPFEPVAREAMRTETRQRMSEADIGYVLEGFA